ncbi:hypothetical protein SAMN04487943_10381 [Gracilibacillus orientalis]|uniref:Uncharacterized protein n=1 Tax=Gracilibacillus orientalis TaxID=334253 RepID=A0A1I4JP06_9BACI|nr:hypothetical protein [Gracilibacillus orientalis]SFL68272.1 hypothetical protein SAMN04487943_10381 [Gracilibacillus orientalis]
MLKTSLIYILLNLLLSPVYIFYGFLGFFSFTLLGDDAKLTDLLLSFVITLSPNIITFLIIYKWANKFNLNRKVNLVWFIIITIMLLCFIILNPLEFGEVWNP